MRGDLVVLPFWLGGCALWLISACQVESRAEIGPLAGSPSDALVAAPPVHGAGTEPFVDPRALRKLEAIRGLSFDSGRVEIVDAEARALVSMEDPGAAEQARTEALALLERNDLIGAISISVRAVLLAPQVARNYLALGQGLVTQKGWEAKAVAAYRSGLDRDETSTELWYHHGDALWRTGQLDAAVTSWQKAIELDPSTHVAVERLASVAFLRGDDALAWQHVHRAEALGGQIPPQLRAQLAQRSPEPPH